LLAASCQSPLCAAGLGTIRSESSRDRIGSRRAEQAPGLYTSIPNSHTGRWHSQKPSLATDSHWPGRVLPLRIRSVSPHRLTVVSRPTAWRSTILPSSLAPRGGVRPEYGKPCSAHPARGRWSMRRAGGRGCHRSGRSGPSKGEMGPACLPPRRSLRPFGKHSTKLRLECQPKRLASQFP
jgi:hypothetical protein